MLQYNVIEAYSFQVDNIEIRISRFVVISKLRRASGLMNFWRLIFRRPSARKLRGRRTWLAKTTQSIVEVRCTKRARSLAAYACIRRRQSATHTHTKINVYQFTGD